jgi:ABC-type enterochelin transport system permease subunit
MTRLWLVSGAVGALLLFLFEAPLTLTLGVIGLLVFVALGVLVIAAPGFVAGDDDEPA